MFDWYFLCYILFSILNIIFFIYCVYNEDMVNFKIISMYFFLKNLTIRVLKKIVKKLNIFFLNFIKFIKDLFFLYPGVQKNIIVRIVIRIITFFSLLLFVLFRLFFGFIYNFIHRIIVYHVLF